MYNKDVVYLLYILILIVSACGGINGVDCRVFKSDPKRASECLIRHWNHDLTANPEVVSFLKTHKIYLSYTSIPKRLSNSKIVLETLEPLLDYVESVFIALPKVFKREGTRYDLDDPVLKYRKVKYLQADKDYGPITKLVPAVESLLNQNVTDGVIVTLDDDILFAPGLVAKVIETVILKGGAASTQTNCISAFNISDWPGARCDKNSRTTDIVEGWGAVAYRVNIFSQEILAKLKGNSQKSDSCFGSDDIVISHILASNGIPRWNVDYPHPVIPLKHGDGPDALHNGAGGNEVGGLGGNEVKYKKCLQDLKS